MDIFIKTYKAITKSAFKKRGFKICKNNYYRIINDVFQSCSLHRSVSGNNATIEFVVLPLTNGYLITKDTCGTDHIKNFFDNYSWYEYERNEKDMRRAISDMLEDVEKYLFPFFEKMNSCKSIYNEIKSGNMKFISEDAKLSVALMMGDYAMAEECMKNRIEQSERAYKRNMECGLGEEYAAKMEKIITEEKTFLKKVQEKDDAFFQCRLSENQKNNMQAFKRI